MRKTRKQDGALYKRVRKLRSDLMKASKLLKLIKEREELKKKDIEHMFAVNQFVEEKGFEQWMPVVQERMRDSRALTNLVGDLAASRKAVQRKPKEERDVLTKVADVVKSAVLNLDMSFFTGNEKKEPVFTQTTEKEVAPLPAKTSHFNSRWPADAALSAEVKAGLLFPRFGRGGRIVYERTPPNYSSSSSRTTRLALGRKRFFERMEQEQALATGTPPPPNTVTSATSSPDTPAPKRTKLLLL